MTAGVEYWLDIINMNRNSILIVVVIILISLLGGCRQNSTVTVISIASPRATTSQIYFPNYTAQQAIGIVQAAIFGSVLSVRNQSGYYQSAFNYNTRQWIITTWAQQQWSTVYPGSVYLVDDATGKLLNPPPYDTSISK